MGVVGVVGAGAMGAGIAQVALAHGHRVVISDTFAPALATARAEIERALTRQTEKGRLTREEAADARSRLTLQDPSLGLQGMSGCEMVIEAIAERLDVKRATFRSIEQVVGPACILATNTSSLSVASIGAACEAPERVLGVHFFNPAPLMRLVEIIPGVRTSSEAVRTARALVESWGKITVLASDTPGFVVNRIARPFYGEALRIVEDGDADPATVDWALRARGFRMGPFELMDFIGHDVNYVVTEAVWTAMYFDPRYRPSLMQKRLLESGLLGKKTGRGFYDYTEGALRPEPTRDEALAERISRRVLAMLVNEAVDAVYLRVATPADIELAMTKGVNYPRGLLAWGNELGASVVLEELERLRADTGDARYRPSQLLRRCVRDNHPLPQ